MGRVPVLLPIDKNSRVVNKFLDAFEYVWGNTTGATHYFGYLHPDGPFVISQVSNPGTATEHVKFYLDSAGTGAAMATLWGDGSGLSGLTYVEYDALY